MVKAGKSIWSSRYYSCNFSKSEEYFQGTQCTERVPDGGQSSLEEAPRHPGPGIPFKEEQAAIPALRQVAEGRQKTPPCVWVRTRPKGQSASTPLAHRPLTELERPHSVPTWA